MQIYGVSTYLAPYGLLSLTHRCRDPEQTRQLFERYQPTYVIHLAALGKI
jgi:hypothetical protein